MSAACYIMLATYGHVFLGCLLLLAALWFVLPWLLKEDHHGR